MTPITTKVENCWFMWAREQEGQTILTVEATFPQVLTGSGSSLQFSSGDQFRTPRLGVVETKTEKGSEGCLFTAAAKYLMYAFHSLSQQQCYYIHFTGKKIKAQKS